MSRSFRKTPIFPIASDKGVKFYKKIRWSRERAKVRDKINMGDFDLLEFIQYRFDEWDTPRDGKYFNANADKKDLTK